MKNGYCGDPSKFLLVIIVKKGPRTKWITAIEQSGDPHNLLYIQYVTVVSQAYLEHPVTF